LDQKKIWDWMLSQRRKRLTENETDTQKKKKLQKKEAISGGRKVIHG